MKKNSIDSNNSSISFSYSNFTSSNSSSSNSSSSNSIKSIKSIQIKRLNSSEYVKIENLNQSLIQDNLKISQDDDQFNELENEMILSDFESNSSKGKEFDQEEEETEEEEEEEEETEETDWNRSNSSNHFINLNHQSNPINSKLSSSSSRSLNQNQNQNSTSIKSFNLKDFNQIDHSAFSLSDQSNNSITSLLSFPDPLNSSNNLNQSSHNSDQLFISSSNYLQSSSSSILSNSQIHSKLYSTNHNLPSSTSSLNQKSTSNSPNLESSIQIHQLNPTHDLTNPSIQSINNFNLINEKLTSSQLNVYLCGAPLSSNQLEEIQIILRPKLNTTHHNPCLDQEKITFHSSITRQFQLTIFRFLQYLLPTYFEINNLSLLNQPSSLEINLHNLTSFSKLDQESFILSLPEKSTLILFNIALSFSFPPHWLKLLPTTRPRSCDLFKVLPIVINENMSSLQTLPQRIQALYDSKHSGINQSICPFEYLITDLDPTDLSISSNKKSCNLPYEIHQLGQSSTNHAPQLGQASMSFQSSKEQLDRRGLFAFHKITGLICFFAALVTCLIYRLGILEMPLLRDKMINFTVADAEALVIEPLGVITDILPTLGVRSPSYGSNHLVNRSPKPMLGNNSHLGKSMSFKNTPSYFRCQANGSGRLKSMKLGAIQDVSKSGQKLANLSYVISSSQNSIGLHDDSNQDFSSTHPQTKIPDFNPLLPSGEHLSFLHPSTYPTNLKTPSVTNDVYHHGQIYSSSFDSIKTWARKLPKRLRKGLFNLQQHPAQCIKKIIQS
ncbi:hypothetical protein O181_045649 [Austropuccinia psidii MF-1]|uniref:Uncharacterized protein n=1 Tax=Austropuccinia psidii MF-1 TaxID=1389203 RepID=A0A9Q3DML5_9BASI|nr:hypothetical protein [Austropuccinia psidii MF-1]